MSPKPELPLRYSPVSPQRRRRCEYCDFGFVIIMCIVGLVVVFAIYTLAGAISSAITSNFSSTVPKFHVDDVKLTEFKFSPTNDTFYYNLAVNMTFRNPSKRVRILYEKIEGNLVYHGQRFGMAGIRGFYLGHNKENNNVRMVFKGEQSVVFDRGQKAKYDSETKGDDHVYKIDLKLRLKMSFKPLLGKTDYIFECNLKVPLSSLEGKVSSAAKFERTKCSFKNAVYYDYDYDYDYDD